jgi:hypothetical protein
MVLDATSRVIDLWLLSVRDARPSGSVRLRRVRHDGWTLNLSGAVVDGSVVIEELTATGVGGTGTVVEAVNARATGDSSSRPPPSAAR